MKKIKKEDIKCIIMNPEYLQNNKNLSIVLSKLFGQNLTQHEVNKIINSNKNNNY
ncbi:MAG: hypothetical protein K0R54_1483 [Clostridiaceae bacterium]|jgi:hypothetical protein|nr:hypothetical protein [Clostridiaceae bacterium]